MKGVYNYRYKTGGVLVGASVNVEVLGRTGTQYKVKYLGFHANGAPVGHVTFVRMDRVTVDHAAAERDLPKVGKPAKPKRPAKIPTWKPYKD